jgi:hypothetical protein
MAKPAFVHVAPTQPGTMEIAEGAFVIWLDTSQPDHVQLKYFDGTAWVPCAPPTDDDD